VLALLALSPAARAQVELVDPDAPGLKSKRPAKPAARAVKEVDPDTTEQVPDEAVEPPTPEPRARPEPDVPAPRPSRSTREGPGAAAEARRSADRAAPPPLQVVRVSDADLEQAWLRWKKVEAGTDIKAEQAARGELVSLKATVGASDMESWAMGLLRASELHELKGDSGAAVELALTATELAPSLPGAWSGLAMAYLRADPASVPRYAGAMGTALLRQLTEYRYQRALLADLGAALLLALLLTTVAVVGVLALRRGYYFLYDFHFLFPRAATRWQTTAVAVLLLSLPLVFRMGVVPALLGLLAAVALYTTLSERLVAAALIAALGLVPTLGALLVEATAFAETPAAELALIERGGPGVEPLVQKWEALAAEDKVGYGERFVLGRHYLRRGNVERAKLHLTKALVHRPDSVPARINLGVAYFLDGDLENSRSLLEAVAHDSGNPAALYDLGRVYFRRVAVYGEAAASEVDKAMAALSEANQADPSLPRAADDRTTVVNANQSLRTVPLDRATLATFAQADEAAEQVRSQLTAVLLGDVPSAVAALYPLVVAMLLVAFGGLARSLQVARECNRCGNAVSTRGDPDLSPGSQICTQCINVFSRKGVVAPSLRVRKQLEVARYHSRRERTGLLLGAVFSGLGHVFGGWPVRGALYAFLFVVCVSGVLLRHGVLRTPYFAVPTTLKLVPALLTLGLVYLLSLRGLRRRLG
jgi:tetratricopeptide (TPR) repeat protein